MLANDPDGGGCELEGVLAVPSPGCWVGAGPVVVELVAVVEPGVVDVDPVADVVEGAVAVPVVVPGAVAAALVVSEPVVEVAGVRLVEPV